MNRDNIELSWFEFVGRGLGRSRGGQLFVAVLVPVVFGFAAFFLWRVRDLVFVVAAAALVFWGLWAAWRLLPIPSGTRVRWAREEELARRCPAHRYRKLLFLGVYFLALGFHGDASFRFGLSDPFFVVGGVLILAGLASFWVCRRFVSRVGGVRGS